MLNVERSFVGLLSQVPELFGVCKVPPCVSNMPAILLRGSRTHMSWRYKAGLGNHREDGQGNVRFPAMPVRQFQHVKIIPLQEPGSAANLVQVHPP